jgi:hypothetical protein
MEKLWFLRIFKGGNETVKIVMIFSSLDHNKKKFKFCVKGQQNGGEIQDGRQTRICQNSANFNANRLKFWISKEPLN